MKIKYAKYSDQNYVFKFTKETYRDGKLISSVDGYLKNKYNVILSASNLRDLYVKLNESELTAMYMYRNLHAVVKDGKLIITWELHPTTHITHREIIDVECLDYFELRQKTYAKRY